MAQTEKQIQARLAHQWGPDNPPPRAGRPRKLLTMASRELLAEQLPEELRKKYRMPKGVTWAKAINIQLARTALRQSHVGVHSAKELRESSQGRAPIALELTGDLPPVEVNVQFETRVVMHVAAPDPPEQLQTIDCPCLPAPEPETEKQP
jgi:hypothetical protein